MRQDDLSFRRTGFARTELLERLRYRYAASQSLDADRVVFLPSPSVAALLDRDNLDLHRLGPVEAPITAVIVSREDPIRAWETVLSDALIEAGLAGLSEVSRVQENINNNNLINKIEALLQLMIAWPEVTAISRGDESLCVELADRVAFKQRLAGLGVKIDIMDDIARIPLLTVADAEAFLSRLDASEGRRASVRRTTKETDIFATVSLEASGPISIRTGVEYFDHMLEQVAKHGGFSLEIICDGDTGVDAHHTIEDVILTFGEALGQALGDRRGIGRFGFELPMDETRAGVWIDLSGRPFARFSGDIPGEQVGAFPVEMTPHVFRSLADSLKAAIHVEVTGENSHHMIEACFKAFGRALRQALKVEGNTIPSTKGVL